MPRISTQSTVNMVSFYILSWNFVQNQSFFLHAGGSLIISFLIQNLSGVDIKISTVRNVQEDEALHQINSLIDQLICKVHDDEREKKTVCNNYIKLCNSGKNLCTNSAQNFTTVSSTGICVEMSENCETSVGGDFYSLITKCTVDDQHRVRMRLAGLRDYIESQEKALKQPADVCSEWISIVYPIHWDVSVKTLSLNGNIRLLILVASPFQKIRFIWYSIYYYLLPLIH